MKLLQILLSQSEAGAETYFEKVASAFAQDTTIEQKLIIEALPSREKRLANANVKFKTLPMGKVTKPLFYNTFLKKHTTQFHPDLILTWVNRASRKCPDTDAVVVGRLGGYYDINNYKKCDHLIVNTPDLVRHVVDNGWPKDRVSMISNFGELPRSLNTQEPLPTIPAGHKVILTLGRLHDKKAQDIAIKALPNIPNAILLIAGSGELEQSLKDLALEQGVSDRVQFLGLRKDIYQLFSLADICLFPSRFEPLGNVVLEAWATQTPIVAAASTGPSWLIEDYKNGRLFPIDDVSACANAVNEVLANEELRALIVDEGYQKFEAEFSQSHILNQYKRLFLSLIEQKKLGKLAKPTSAAE